jgi:cysteinyl-tRNA synthetase
MDFVLWKPSKPGEPAWPSPSSIATPGRPGWHIECSAMSWKHLGETFDIHGGGVDLVFPHHENEIAQSRCAFHSDVMATHWMHNGFLQVEGEKMAKSAGNFVTIRELLKDWPGNVVRLSMLKTHYRQPIDWTLQSLRESTHTFADWAFSLDTPPGKTSPEFVEALLDDLNTPRAVAELHRLSRVGDLPGVKAALELLGLVDVYSAGTKFTRRVADQIDTSRINALIDSRNAARAMKNFKEADRIRDELAVMGVVLKDSKDGTTWELAP